MTLAPIMASLQVIPRVTQFHDWPYHEVAHLIAIAPIIGSAQYAHMRFYDRGEHAIRCGHYNTGKMVQKKKPKGYARYLRLENP